MQLLSNLMQSLSSMQPCASSSHLEVAHAIPVWATPDCQYQPHAWTSVSAVHGTCISPRASLPGMHGALCQLRERSMRLRM
jgi:hypothetical protein